MLFAILAVPGILAGNFLMMADRSTCRFKPTRRHSDFPLMLSRELCSDYLFLLVSHLFPFAFWEKRKIPPTKIVQHGLSVLKFSLLANNHFGKCVKLLHM